MNNTNEKRRILLDFAEKNARRMFNDPMGILRRPFLDPGGSYSGNLWDWDSFWAATALLGIAEELNDDQLKQETLKYAKGALLNFFDFQAEDGSVAIVLRAGDRDFLECHKPGQNIGKPVHGQFARLLDRYGVFSSDEKAHLVSALTRLYKCRVSRAQSQPTGLFVWNNDTAIGVDDDPSTWARPDNSSANIYLNSLVYADCMASAEFCASCGAEAESVFFRTEGEKLKQSIRKYCFDKRDGMYYSADVQCVRKQPKYGTMTLNANLEPFWHVLLLKVGNWSSFMPLWANIATPEEAERMVRENLMDPARFWTPYGIRSLAAYEPMYQPEAVRGNPSNWLGPVWIITCYVVWKGLCNYGYTAEADELAGNVIRLLTDDVAATGQMHEYYSPETGNGICGPGFLNWNFLACLMK